MKRSFTIALAAVAVFVVVFASIIFVTSEGGRVDVGEEEDHVAEWTTFFWFCGDGNLGELNMMLCDIHFLEMVDDSEDVNLIGILDKEEQGDTKLIKIEKNGSVEMNLTDIDPEWTDNELNLGDTEPLIDFLAWGVENYPAMRYNIHLVNHGGGWRGMCWDERSDDHLSLPEIREVCEAFKLNTGRNVDILSTEGCLVGMVEFAYELKDTCDYFVGGSTFGWGAEADPANDVWEPGNWQYDTCWQAVVDRPTMSAEEFACVMGDTFEPYGPWRAPPAMPKQGYSDVMGVYNLSYIDELVSSIDDMASFLLSKVQGIGQVLNQALLINMVIGHPETPDDYHTESFSAQMDWMGIASFTNYDLWDFAYMLTKSSAGTLKTSTAGEVMDGVGNVIMVYRNVDEPGGHPDAHGISIYIPYRTPEYNPLYEETMFAQDTQWDEFIQSVHWG